MRTIPSRIVCSLVLVLAAGCGGCRSKEIERSGPGAFFPPGAPAFVAIEEPKLLSAVAALLGAGLADATALVGEDPLAPVVRELGFDPRTPEGFYSVGLDPERSMAIGLDAEDRRLAVFAVRDAGAAERWMEEQARRRGGRVRTERTYAPEEGKPRAVVAYLDPKGRVRLAHALAGRWLVAAEGEAAVETVGAALARAEADSLVATQAYASLRKSVGENRSVWGWLPPPPKGKRAGMRLAERGASFGATVREKELDVRVRLPQGTMALSVLQSAASVKEGESLLPYLSKDDFLLVRLGGDPQAFEPLLRDFTPYRRLHRAGFDPATEILPLVEPGVVMGISLQPEPNLAAGLPGGASLARTNPFQLVRTSILARVKDPAKARAALERLAELDDRLQMEIRTRGEGEQTIWTAHYAAGEGLSWTLRGNLLMAGGGESAFFGLAERIEGGGVAYEPADPKAFELFRSQPLGVYLDVPRLVAQLRAIPESAFGIGGFRIKGLLDGWISAIEPLRGLALAYHVDNEAIVLDARLAIE